MTERYHIDRSFQDEFVRGLALAGFDDYGGRVDWEAPIPPSPWPASATDTGRFVVCPFAWDDDLAELDLPNVLDRATGTEIRWYKYALRSATSNKPLSHEDLSGLLDALAKQTQSLRARPHDPNTQQRLEATR